MVERFTTKTVSVGTTADMGLFGSMNRIAIMMENASGGVVYFGNRNDATLQSGYPLGPSRLATGAQEAEATGSGAGRVHLCERNGDVVTPEFWFSTVGLSKEVRVWEAFTT